VPEALLQSPAIVAREASAGAAHEDRGVPAQADRRLMASLLARGERDLADGNVAMARQAFLRAAEAGMAHGALLLAATYDAHEFARLGVQGVQANPRLARIWYQRARELGASEAEALLRRLGDSD
jgi:TPR repeat protein